MLYLYVILLIVITIDFLITLSIPFFQHWEKSSNDISSNDVYAFNCQHGPPECEGNKVHACVVKYVTDDEKRMDFIHCMIDDNYKPVECGEKVSSTINFKI